MLLMKRLIIIGFIGLTFFSCRKDKYVHFDTRQLVFVNYLARQELKFIDTASVVDTLEQTIYSRDFSQAHGLFGYSGDFIEKYNVSYVLQNTGIEQLRIFQSAARGVPGYSLSLSFFSYGTLANPDSLSSPFSALTINGKTYTDVYSLKVYKDSFLNSNDTATLFNNKEYGVIEMLFPDGKKIVRTE
jgi:hypothetical protein